MFAPKNILVPTDFSKYSHAALDTAMDIAAQRAGRAKLDSWISGEAAL